MSEPVDELSATTPEKVGDYGAAAINLIPILGGALGSLAQKYIHDRQSARLEAFLKDLAEDLEAVKDRLNQEFLTRDEARQLFDEVLDGVTQSAQPAKLAILERIVVITFTASNPSYSQASEMIDTVRQLQLRHFKLLKLLAAPAEANRALGEPVKPGIGFPTTINQIVRKLIPDMSEDEIDRTWRDLYQRQMTGTPDTKTMITDTGIMQLENRLKPFGRQVAEYVRTVELR